ncbi:MAG TPA: aminotransferase class V-fold PLP-dependent enzyme [Vicinamibacteria bacterium]|nr:aminotransferase class V-fold PLP-dependent enzyme [Vicinamibacteria bacterium]
MATRRAFLSHVGAASAAAVAFRDHAIDVVEAAGSAAGPASAAEMAGNEDYWREIQGAFTLDRTMINLNNGGVCPSPRVVMDALKRYLDQSNQAPVWNMWQQLEPGIEGVRRDLAAEFGCDPEEMAITRNASESLEICILGLDLKPGDEILTTNQDYPRMLTAWRQRERRDGVVMKQFSFPVPAPSMDDLYERFVKGVTPKTKVILICHITNLTGQIFPVKRVCDFARSRGIDVIVDGAHAFGQWPIKHKDLDCDFYGVSLHKWMLAPIGTGFLYVRKNRIKSVWPLMAAEAKQDEDIRKYEEIGTHPAANHNAIAEAIVFHRGIGVERKAARFRYLRDRWMKRLAANPKFVINTSFDPLMSCAIGNVGIRDIDTGKLQAHLWAKKRIFTVAIVHAEYQGLRITPNVYTTLEEIDAFADEMERVAAKGLPA